MLCVNPNNAVESQIKEAYSREVARRIGQNYWTFPARNNAMVPAAANAVLRLKANVEEYVRSHFVALDRDFCLKIFHMSYPPFGCMVGPRAKARYEKYMLTVDSFKKSKSKSNNDLIETVYAQVRIFSKTRGSRSIPNLKLLVASKSISLHTLAYLRLNKLINKDSTAAVLDFLYEDKSEGDIYDRYSKAEKEVRGFLGIKDERA